MIKAPNTREPCADAGKDPPVSVEARAGFRCLCGECRKAWRSLAATLRRNGDKELAAAIEKDLPSKGADA